MALTGGFRLLGGQWVVVFKGILGYRLLCLCGRVSRLVRVWLIEGLRYADTSTDHLTGPYPLNLNSLAHPSDQVSSVNTKSKPDPVEPPPQNDIYGLSPIEWRVGGCWTTPTMTGIPYHYYHRLHSAALEMYYRQECPHYCRTLFILLRTPALPANAPQFCKTHNEPLPRSPLRLHSWVTRSYGFLGHDPLGFFDMILYLGFPDTILGDDSYEVCVWLLPRSRGLGQWEGNRADIRSELHCSFT